MSLFRLTHLYSNTSISVLFISLFLVACDATLPTKEQAHSVPDNQKETIADTTDKRSVKVIAQNKLEISQTNTQTNKSSLDQHDLWQRIRNRYQLPIDNIPSQGQQRIDSILSRYTQHPDSILRQTNRASLYLYYIVNELEKHNLPAELALLPFVESGYDPFAYSSGRASGLWQFIPGTGRRFKLTKNWWIDERRDVVASTQAAIQYFTYLNQHFNGDWLLTLAAYNAGEGTVGRAIQKNKKKGKPTDYWSLPLPRETRFYIPKLLAWSAIVKEPKKYQLRLTPIKNAPQFTMIDIGSQIDLATLSDITDIDINKIYALNPAFNRWATDPQEPHTLLMPHNKSALVKKVLNQYPVDQRIQ